MVESRSVRVSSDCSATYRQFSKEDMNREELKAAIAHTGRLHSEDRLHEAGLTKEEIAETDSPLRGKDIFQDIIKLQEENSKRQQHLLELIMQTGVDRSLKPPLEVTKPEIYDGSSSMSAQAWLDFYEYACDQNFWNHDRDKIMHMRFYVGGVAKTWHGIRATEKAGHPWAD